MTTRQSYLSKTGRKKNAIPQVTTNKAVPKQKDFQCILVASVPLSRAKAVILQKVKVPQQEV